MGEGYRDGRRRVGMCVGVIGAWRGRWEDGGRSGCRGVVGCQLLGEFLSVGLVSLL